MKFDLARLAILLLLCGNAAAADGFEAVRCGGNIPEALIGRHSPNGRVVDLEARHRNLSLKDLGGVQITDQIFMIEWSICGKNYMLLQDDHDIVRNVLAFPPHSKRSPAFTGICEINGHPTAETVVAVLDNGAGYKRDYDLTDNSLFPVMQAWKIDEKSVKFVKIKSAGMRCPRVGIDTADGGP